MRSEAARVKTQVIAVLRSASRSETAQDLNCIEKAEAVSERICGFLRNRNYDTGIDRVAVIDVVENVTGYPRQESILLELSRASLFFILL